MCSSAGCGTSGRGTPHRGVSRRSARFTDVLGDLVELDRDTSHRRDRATEPSAFRCARSTGPSGSRRRRPAGRRRRRWSSPRTTAGRPGTRPARRLAPAGRRRLDGRANSALPVGDPDRPLRRGVDAVDAAGTPQPRPPPPMTRRCRSPRPVRRGPGRARLDDRAAHARADRAARPAADTQRRPAPTPPPVSWPARPPTTGSRWSPTEGPAAGRRAYGILTAVPEVRLRPGPGRGRRAARRRPGAPSTGQGRWLGSA